MLKITAISDLHGHLPDILPTDLLIIAGDICPYSKPLLQSKWLYDEFSVWLEGVPAKEIVAIAGNHDVIFEKTPQLIPKLKWHYLQDKGIELYNLNIYGTPWQPRYMNWAFNLDEPELEQKFSRIPTGTDIVVCHGPPWGYGDMVDAEHKGSSSLKFKLLEISPFLMVCGHIHEGWGIYNMNDYITVANASLMSGDYLPANPPIVFGVENKRINHILTNYKKSGSMV